MVKILLLLLILFKIELVSQTENRYDIYREIYLKINPNTEIFTMHFPDKIKVDSICWIIDDTTWTKFFYLYNSAGKIKTKGIYYWHFGSYDEGFIENWFYNEEGLLDTIIITAGGENYLLHTYYYNEQGQLIASILQEWLSFSWEFALKIESYYNSSGLVDSTITYKWENQIWVNASKQIFNYYENNLISFSVGQVWEGNFWENYLSFIYSYNDNWILDNLLVQEFIDTSWNNYVRTVYSYDYKKFITIGTLEQWINNQWVLWSRYTYTYNNEYYFQNGYWEEYQNGSWLPMVGLMHVKNPDRFEEHFMCVRAYIYYSPLVSVYEKAVVTNFVLEQNYPNPFNPLTSIDYQIIEFALVNLKVYDIFGKEVEVLVNEEKYPGKYSILFNASNLSSGVYFYRLVSKDYTSTKKMILVK